MKKLFPIFFYRIFLSPARQIHANKIKSFFIISSCVISVQISCAQNKNSPREHSRTIDSLLTLLQTDKPDTNKVNHLNKMSMEYTNIGLYDSGVYYGDAASKLAKKIVGLSPNKTGAGLKWIKQGIANTYVNTGNIYMAQYNFSKAIDCYYNSLKTAEEIGDKNLVANALGNIGTINYNQGDYHKALDYYFRTLKIEKELGNKKGIAIYLGNIGVVYYNQGDYPKALDYYLKGLKIEEGLLEKKRIAGSLSNIGGVYYNQGEYTKALEYFFKALKIDEELKDKRGKANRLGNIGNIYLIQKDYPKALDYFFKALKIAEELGFKNGIAVKLGNIGLVFKEQKDYPKALNYYFKALKIVEEMGNKKHSAAIFDNIGSLYTATGKFKEAEKYLKRANTIADSIHALDYLKESEESLSQLFDTMGLHKEALVHYKKAVALKDTIFSQENKKQLVRKEMNYEFDKKEAATKAENDKQKAVAKEKSHKQKVVLLLVSCVLLLVFVFAGFIFRSLRITRKQKQIIEIKSRETEEQKKIIAEKNKDMVDSIRYASAIQQAAITSESYIADHLQEFFILYLPKDIVAGDFYWAFNQDDEFFIATADCTGHGVPGAFMSLMGINFLNEIVVEQKIASPSETLNRLREQIIRAFSSGKTERKDGMDICLYKLNKKAKTLTYSAANNPLWLCRNNEITEHKPDKMPVGAHHGALTPFSEHTIALQKGDIIYTSTDGYADQFGVNGKKLMKKTLKEELLKIHNQPMVEQKKHLTQFFENWKGDGEQVDDVCVIGVRI